MSQAFYDTGLTYDSGIVYADGASGPGERQPMAKVKVDLSDLKYSDYVQRLDEIVAAMDGNALFAALQTQITALKNKVIALKAKEAQRAAAQQEADTFLTERDSLKDESEDMAVSLAAGVDNVAQGDAAVILQSGFSTRAPRTPTAPVEAPQNLRATMNTMAGKIDLRWRRVARAGSYIVQMATNANGPWTQLGVPMQARFTAEGLTPGTKYYFRVIAVGPLGPGPESDIAEKMAP